MAEEKQESWQERLHEVIYESKTVSGKAFDVALLFLIVVSIIIVMLDSVEIYHKKYGQTYFILEWVITGIFTIEYILRLICIKNPLKYIFSFLGIIDMLAIIPSYLSVFFWEPNPCWCSGHCG